MNQLIKRILCVDDDPRNLSLLQAVLISRGYDVVTASNGFEALEKIQHERIDICLLDVMMPGMDGFEVCSRIKNDDLLRNIPIVMITSLGDKENRIRGIEAGAEDFICKPFDTTEVLARIKMLLHVKSLNDRLNSAYQNISRLSVFGEQIITSFDPVHFDFMEKVDSIVNQIIRKGFDLVDSPQIVIVGILDQAGSCQWSRYDSRGKTSDRSPMTLNLAAHLTFSESGSSEAIYYNQSDSEMNISELVTGLKDHQIPVLNMVRYANESFCLIALNYGREVTIYDSTVLNSVVMQSLFLKSLACQVMNTKSAFEYTVLALARASEANDEDTGDHVLRVGDYSAMLARQLNLPEQLVHEIRVQSALHDVGKIHISPAILKKPGKLTDVEWGEMKQHTLYGSKIIGGHDQMGTANRIALSHHERYDGSGYPYGLKGPQIPIEGRIMNLADQYDALRNKRCYKDGFDHDTVFRILTEGDGRTIPQHFDPEVLNAFREIHGKFAELFEKGDKG